MRKPKDKIFWWVCGTHGSIIFLLVVIPFLRGCFRPKPKEPVVFVEMVSDAPPSAQTPSKEILPSEPEPEPEPEPAKPVAPAPKPKPKPEPKVEPAKPKWKPAEVVKQNRRVTRQSTTPKTQTPVRKQPSSSQIRNALSSSINQENAYYGTVFARYYAVWQQPTTLPIGLSAQATIRVEKSGRISFAQITRRSGNSTFDQSVQNALNAVSSLPVPPAELAGNNITIDFVLD